MTALSSLEAVLAAAAQHLDVLPDRIARAEAVLGGPRQVRASDPVGEGQSA